MWMSKVYGRATNDRQPAEVRTHHNRSEIEYDKHYDIILAAIPCFRFVFTQFQTIAQ